MNGQARSYQQYSITSRQMLGAPSAVYQSFSLFLRRAFDRKFSATLSAPAAENVPPRNREHKAASKQRQQLLHVVFEHRSSVRSAKAIGATKVREARARIIQNMPQLVKALVGHMRTLFDYILSNLIFQQTIPRIKVTVVPFSCKSHMALTTKLESILAPLNSCQWWSSAR